MGNPTELYLPLLTHADTDVRRQAATLLLATYGERGLTFLRRLLDDPAPELRARARAALLTVASVSGIHVELRPFRGIYVRCLGDLKVFINSREVQSADWSQEDGGRAGGRKVQGLFAFLIHRSHQGATRPEIADAVWGGSVSTVSISRTLGALRQLLIAFGSAELAAQTLLVSRERIALNPASYLCDADHFERTFQLACQREDQDGLGAAQPLYHQVTALFDGRYMEGILRGSDWGQERRDIITSSYLIAAERLAEHAYVHRSDRQCVAICRQALTLDPGDDDLTVWLMRAYARQGLWVDVDLAMRHYSEATGIHPLHDHDNPVVVAHNSLRPPEPIAAEE